MTQHFIQLFKGVFVSSLPYISPDPCFFNLWTPLAHSEERKKLSVALYPSNGALLAIYRVAKCENYTSKELCAHIFLFFHEG